MIWTILIVVVVLILFNFLKDLNKDNYDLQSQTIDAKFSIVVSMINEYAFKGSQCFSTLGDISTPVTSNPTESKALNISPLPHPRSINLFLLLSFSSDLRNLANLNG